jgi:hypothetical protein
MVLLSVVIPRSEGGEVLHWYSLQLHSAESLSKHALSDGYTVNLSIRILAVRAPVSSGLTDWP